MVFAIIFGLSMDYEVFLVSRMHEEWDAHEGRQLRGPRTAWPDRQGGDGRRSMIMIAVFGAFALGNEPRWR